MCDEFVAWLDIEMSLIEPSHLSVSVDDVLSELWLLVSAIFVVEADVCKSDVDQCCDDDLDNNSLSCRSLWCVHANVQRAIDDAIKPTLFFIFRAHRR